MKQIKSSKYLNGQFKTAAAARTMTVQVARCFWDRSNAIPTCVGSWTTRQYSVSSAAFWETISITAAVTEIITAAIPAGTPMEAGVSSSPPKQRSILIPLPRDTGALRLIPGSHRPDHFVRKEKIDVNNSMELFGVPPSEFPGSIAVETNPGRCRNL